MLGLGAALHIMLSRESYNIVMAFRMLSLSQIENGAPAPWVPAAVPLMNGARQLPEAYRERLVEHEGGVVVSDTQGPNALVLLSHVPDQPLLLPMVSETFRLQKVKIVRGWLETTDSGAVMDAFEVCDSSTGQPLSSDRATQLEQALMQAIQAPAARQVMVEIDGQVPQLDCFFGLPAGGSLPVSLAAARGALVDGPFKVSEAREVGRSLVFRGELMEGVASKEALDECARRLRQAMVSEDAPPEVRSNAPHHRRLVDDWECLLVRGKTSPLLLWIPLEDLAKDPPRAQDSGFYGIFEDHLKFELDPSFDQRLFFLLTTLATVVCVQYAAPEPGLNPPIGALLLSIIGAAEISRRRTADRLGVRLGLPLLLPSPAMGTFGVAARAKSLVPDAAGLFDLGASALMTALLASFTLIGLGLFMPPDTSSCTWVDPSVFPYVLRQLLVAQYDARSAVCTEPPLGLDGRYVPTSPAIAAGLFGVLMVALNSLPIGQLTNRWHFASFKFRLHLLRSLEHQRLQGMVIRTIRKGRDNLPYRRQSVVGFFAIAKVAGHGLAGEITSEKRDDFDTKIAYTVKLYGLEDQKEVTIAVADVKHSCGTGFEKAVEELRERAEELELKNPHHLLVFKDERANGENCNFYGGCARK
eukprot:s661_g6.t3